MLAINSIGISPKKQVPRNNMQPSQKNFRIRCGILKLYPFHSHPMGWHCVHLTPKAQPSHGMTAHYPNRYRYRDRDRFTLQFDIDSDTDLDFDEAVANTNKSKMINGGRRDWRLPSTKQSKNVTAVPWDGSLVFVVVIVIDISCSSTTTTTTTTNVSHVTTQASDR
jgi:hypothetical protein